MTYPTPLIDDSAHPWIIVRLGLKVERERGREREGKGGSTEKCNNHPSKPFYMLARVYTRPIPLLHDDTLP